MLFITTVFRQTVKDHSALEQDIAAHEKRSVKVLANSLKMEIEQVCAREKHLHDELLQASKQV